MTDQEMTVRARNARGQGSRLREEIVEAATTLLNDGPLDAVTLRAVARAAGITAPSIYRHFADLDAVMKAVVDEASAELADVLSQAREGRSVEALVSVCRAYLQFAADHPQRYRLMFGTYWKTTRSPDTSPATLAELAGTGLDTFDVLAGALADCIAEGTSTSTNVIGDTTALWVGLHGLATLRETTPLFPWPEDLEHDLVTTLARLTEPADRDSLTGTG